MISKKTLFIHFAQINFKFPIGNMILRDTTNDPFIVPGFFSKLLLN